MPDSVIPLVRTFVRSEAPQKLVRIASQTNSRGVSVDLNLHSTTLSGGGIVKGDLLIHSEPRLKKNKSTQVCKIQLDCLGTECKLDLDS